MHYALGCSPERRCRLRLGGSCSELEKHAKEASHVRCLRFVQVHRARLLTGEQVVLKVQRPGLRQLFDIDLKNLEKVRRRWAPQLDGPALLVLPVRSAPLPCPALPARGSAGGCMSRQGGNLQ